jgi:hypothetical protein
MHQSVLTLQANVDALQQELAAVKSNNALALDPFVSVDTNPKIGVAGPHIIFRGVNLHLVSGSNATDDNGTRLGLGNLIIGYDEDPAQLDSQLSLKPGDRRGSHNLVIGKGHRFTQAAFGGLVAGDINTISNEGASVSGGALNTASGSTASVSGGAGNAAIGNSSSISGGFGNAARGSNASVSGGEGNTASGNFASISGGRRNTASGVFSSVSGGVGNTADAEDIIRPQPPFP